MFLAEKVEAEVHFCLLHSLPRKRDSVKRSTLSHPGEHQQRRVMDGRQSRTCTDAVHRRIMEMRKPKKEKNGNNISSSPTTTSSRPAQSSGQSDHNQNVPKSSSSHSGKFGTCPQVKRICRTI